MYIHQKIEVSRVNGPGANGRCVIWVQGCAINGRDSNNKPRPGCPGCWNPQTHAFTGGTFEHPHSLAAWIMAQYRQHRVEGVTFSGGEPMHYLFGLAVLADHVKQVMPWFSLGLYSGYSQNELAKGQFDVYEGNGKEMVPSVSLSEKTKAAEWKRLRKQLDFAVLGRYNSQKPANQPLITSTNQEILLTSMRYEHHDFAPQAVEGIVSPAGDLVTVTGFPMKGLLG